MNLNKIIKGSRGLFCFSDPAGANFIFSILDSFLNQKNRTNFMVITNKTGVFETKYKSITDIIEFNNKIGEKILSDFNPDYIFCATSNNNFEHRVRTFFSGKIIIYSFIDHWCNYLKRFTFNNTTCLGDLIFVIDEVAKKEAIEDGIPEINLRVLNNPYYEKVKKFVPKINKSQFLKQIKLNSNKLIILFVSDCIRDNFKKTNDKYHNLGYDEYSVLIDLLTSLNKIEVSILMKFQLVIKIHPKSSINKFDSIINSYNTKYIDILLVKDYDALTINYYSDYVIGMFSNMVIEAFLLNKKLMRIQIGQIGEDLMKFQYLRNQVIITKEKLDEKLNTFLNT